MRRNDFQVRLNNQTDIWSYNPKPGPASFFYNLQFELQQARVAGGISVEEFDKMPGDHIWLVPGQDMCKADLLVWYRNMNRIKGVSDDIQQREIDRVRRRNTNRYGR